MEKWWLFVLIAILDDKKVAWFLWCTALVSFILVSYLFFSIVSQYTLKYKNFKNMVIVSQSKDDNKNLHVFYRRPYLAISNKAAISKWW